MIKNRKSTVLGGIKKWVRDILVALALGHNMVENLNESSSEVTAWIELIGPAVVPALRASWAHADFPVTGYTCVGDNGEFIDGQVPGASHRESGGIPHGFQRLLSPA